MKHNEIYERVDPLLTTKWIQGSPYNLSVPLYGSSHPDLGCVAIAVGQIMKYHQWPSCYSWSSMPNQLSSSVITTTTLSDFLNTVAQACNVDFSNNSRATINDANSALTNHFNYKNTTSIINHNMYQVHQELMSGRPVYMRGVNSNLDGHAWVCDGSSYLLQTVTYSLKIISVTDNPLHYYSPCPDYEENEYFSFLQHMNWGWNDGNDGWYTDALGNYPTNLTSSRKDIINIIPNNN